MNGTARRNRTEFCLALIAVLSAAGSAAAFPHHSTASLGAAFAVAAMSGGQPEKRKRPAARAAPHKPARRCLSFREISGAGFFSAMESLTYRMCMQEVPFFLALHHCFYRDVRLDRKDTLVLRKPVLLSLMRAASKRLSADELDGSPATSIDSIWLLRAESRRGGATTNCTVVVFTHPGSYDIPRSGAKIVVPAVLKAAIIKKDRAGAVTAEVLTNGVSLELPVYAKVLSLGMITDMDIRYAELLPVENAFEARLLYAPADREVKRRGWSFNITECNKIRPYER